MQIRHGTAPRQGGEYTLCGRAFDDMDSGDAQDKVVFANPGEWITCEECRDFIKEMKDSFTYQGKVKK